jgi:hypothetical protein
MNLNLATTINQIEECSIERIEFNFFKNMMETDNKTVTLKAY